MAVGTEREGRRLPSDASSSSASDPSSTRQVSEQASCRGGRRSTAVGGSLEWADKGSGARLAKRGD